MGPTALGLLLNQQGCAHSPSTAGCFGVFHPLSSLPGSQKAQQGLLWWPHPGHAELLGVDVK